MSFRKDLTGQIFGRLKVLEFAYTKNRRAFWKCKCECGNITIVPTTHLKSGHTKSCGCLYIESRKFSKKIIHGLCKERIYNVWQCMKNRCYNKKHQNYKNYGGRGIKICDSWLNNSKLFFEWALSNGYNDNLTIDRINPNGNYEPENCRWVDIRTQQNNKRNNCPITYNGKTYNLSEWARITGISVQTIKGRFNRGWTVEKALTTGVA